MNHSKVKTWSNKAQYFHKLQTNSIPEKNILHVGDSSWVTSISSKTSNQRIASLQLLLKWITGLICLFKIRNFTDAIMHCKFAFCFVSHEFAFCYVPHIYTWIPLLDPSLHIEMVSGVSYFQLLNSTKFDLTKFIIFYALDLLGWKQHLQCCNSS